MIHSARENGSTTKKRSDAGLGPDAAPCPSPIAPSGALRMIAPCAELSDADPWAVSHPFAQAAQWLRQQAPEIATGSRDFGRGFALAAAMLEDVASGS